MVWDRAKVIVYIIGLQYMQRILQVLGCVVAVYAGDSVLTKCSPDNNLCKLAMGLIGERLVE